MTNCPRPLRFVRHRAPLGSVHARVAERSDPRRSPRSGALGDRPRPHRRRRRLRGDQGHRRAAVRAHPAPGAHDPLGRRPRSSGAADRRRTPWRGGRARRLRPAPGQAPDHLHRGSGAARLRPGRRPADPGRRRRRPRPRGGVRLAGDGALAAQRARRAGRPEDHLVRRERRGPGLRPRARRHGGRVRQPRRPPVRGHRFQRVLRRRRRAADPVAGLGLPGGHHPCPAAGVVRRRGGRRAHRRARRGRGDPDRLDDPRRAGRDPVRRARAAGRAGDRPVPEGVGGPGGARTSTPDGSTEAAQAPAARRRSR